MKLIELLIAVAVFLATVSSASFLLFQHQDMLTSIVLRAHAIELASEYMNSVTDEVGSDFDSATPYTASSTTESFVLTTTLQDIGNFTKQATVTVGYTTHNRELSFSLSQFIVDTRESEGQSSCRPSQDIDSWNNPVVYSFDLGYTGIEPTSIVLRNNKVFISSNSSNAKDPDIYVFDIDHEARELTLISLLDTGPGINDLIVAGDYIYVANTSVNAQLQIIRIEDDLSLNLISSYKIPGAYDDGTTIGNTIFYKKGYVFLGTQKSQIAELHAISVSNVSSPLEVGSYEMNTAVNDIFAFKDKVYIASPDADELQVFSFTGGALGYIQGYDAQGSASNGKKLSFLLGNVFLGRTLGQKEIYSIREHEDEYDAVFNFSTGISVHGIEAYGKLLFVALNSKSNGFQIYDISTSTPKQISQQLISFENNPIGMSCDKSIFGVIQAGNTISFITNQIIRNHI